MDISTNRRSGVLYSDRHRKPRGIVDLRCFSENKGKKDVRQGDKNKKAISEIVAGENGRMPHIVNLRKKKSKSLPCKLPHKHSREECTVSEYKKSINQYAEILYRDSAENRYPAQNSKSPFYGEKTTTGNVNACPTVRIKSFCNFLLCQKKSLVYFISMSFIVSSVIFSLSFVQKGIEQRGRALGASIQAYNYLQLAGQSVGNFEFRNGMNNLSLAALNFAEANNIIDEFGMGITKILNNIPVDTPITTVKNLTSAGENISLAGKNLAELLHKISGLDKNDFSINYISNFQTNINGIALYLRKTQDNINNIDLDYIPEGLREKVDMLKNQLPAVAQNFENLSQDIPVIVEAFGKPGLKKYLIIFENNSEMRATGGFIGSYAILDMENGRIKNLFIDDVFNLDGQLKKNVIPPKPIQKISASWSMHDANWFADFPTSARKVALFYERAGGSTVDGVIAITPNVIEKMLEITGPIEISKYNVTIDKENFLSKTQLQVEDLYDRSENKPKQFLADLAPKIIEKMFHTETLNNTEKIQRYLGFINAIEESLNEKHIILYFRDTDLENMIVKNKWGGKILNSSGDYLNVVHSNINGYKTDAVIDEQILHEAEIFSDGSIIDTVKIIREHTGGSKSYDWYNRVNSDYMRVYVPYGSVLLEAKGHTLQDYESFVDYSKFETDPGVVEVENSVKIDPDSGTYIFKESGKTVFGNWVFVSPGERVEVVYKYKLPYKVDFDNFTKPADKYNILVQKQLGSYDRKFFGSIKLPKGWNVVWKSQEIEAISQTKAIIQTDLETDKIYGIVFDRNIEE